MILVMYRLLPSKTALWFVVRAQPEQADNRERVGDLPAIVSEGPRRVLLCQRVLQQSNQCLRVATPG